MTEPDPLPKGAVPTGDGVRFTIASRHAKSVRLALFESPSDSVESHSVDLERVDDTCFTGFVRGIGAGAVYALRVDGPSEADDVESTGHRFNPDDLLLDPHARAICGPSGWRDAVYGADPTARPKCVVVDRPGVEALDDARPSIPLAETLIYECHVGSLTRRHPDVPAELRGTYLGLACEPVVDHLQGLGVTAVELLPVQASVTEAPLAATGRSNVWGYSPIAFLAPDARFASGDLGQQVDEFRRMTAALHRAGIEVILDVVFNHTGEGPADSPALSLRGIDNAGYYRLDPDDRSRYVDWTGCGNTLDVTRDLGRDLVLDALRTWVVDLGVDGFRFDLAASIARDPDRPEDLSDLIRAIDADPVLGKVKRIAEPWDLGPGGGFLGRFPDGWCEWNERFRDTVRRFWRGDASATSDFATRMTGSSDVFAPSGRGPQASVSFVTAHDGFTLRDLVSYEQKHNEANGEENRDGSDYNFSDNHGVEGPTDDAAVESARARSARNLLATLYLSRGVPMLLAGDELGRTQHGNNNGYCLDEDVAAVPFDEGADEEMHAFVRRLAKLRAAWPALRRPEFFLGEPAPGESTPDLTWLQEDGQELTEPDWHDPDRLFLAARIHEEGKTLILLLNGGENSCFYPLPDDGDWKLALDTALPDYPATAVRETIEVSSRSLVALVDTKSEDA